MNIFIEEFPGLLRDRRFSNKTTFIRSDFNKDLLKISSNNRYNDFRNLLMSCGYLPTITL